MNHDSKRILTVIIGMTLLIAVTVVVADELRTLKRGQEVPDLTLPTLAGEQVALRDQRGKVLVLVFLSARQRSSEKAAVSAHQIVQKFRPGDISLLFATADAAQSAYFRAQRDRDNVHEPLMIDFERKLYGGLGLIVMPTTIVVDREGKLLHVISAYRSDYEHVLETYIRHGLGELDEGQLEKALESATFQHNRAQDRIARHRAAARLLRENSLFDDARNELEAALAIKADDDETLLDLASLDLAQKRIDEAAGIVDSVLKDEPRHRRARLMRGIILFKTEHYDEAERVLTEALSLNPDPVQILYYLGRIHERRGDTAKAAEYYRRALERLLEDRPI
jgi:tetratricopeptide (TPR) repeat protein